MTDLRTLVPLPTGLALDSAWAINDQGQIAASGNDLLDPPTVVGYRLTPRSKVDGDYDCNHIVDVADLLGVLSHWGPANGPADFNRDGVVNTMDLMTVINGWTLE